jgi:hypothetical protein
MRRLSFAATELFNSVLELVLEAVLEAVLESVISVLNVEDMAE